MENNKAGVQIGKKAFLSSVMILLILMILAGILTRVIPAGSFERTIVDGREIIDPESFQFIEEVNYPIYRWVTAPIEVLFSPEAPTVIVIIAFIMIIGGTFATLDKSGMLQYMMSGLVVKYANSKYRLMAVMILFFMLFGSVFGVFEELVALVPIMITLSYSMGWDSLVGLGMSALASGFGFAAATLNPFTLGVAQKIAGLPSFSGLLFRIPVFLLCYIILFLYIRSYAKKIERNPTLSSVYEEDRQQREKYKNNDGIRILENAIYLKKAVKIFGAFMGLVMVLILLGFFIPALSAVSLPIMALLFFIGGMSAAKAAKYGNTIGKDFFQGVVGIAPGAILILMAMSVKLIITNGGIMDTILYYAADSISNTSPYVAAVMIYLLVLVLNFFIGSGSAKAFLILPIIAPLTDLVGITRQVAVQAFCFGDGFTNMIYPTNPLLMITLGVTIVSYPKWLKWTIKIQLIMFLVTILLLLLAVSIGYGPF